MQNLINKYSKRHIFNIFLGVRIFMCNHFGVTLRKFTDFVFGRENNKENLIQTWRI